MNLDDLNFFHNRLKIGENNFHNLMAFRVRKILLVATFYDAYTIEHDGRLTEQITGDYFRLNLTTIPRITSVTSGHEALALLKSEQFDLVITTLRIGESDPFELSERIHAFLPEQPVILLLTVKSDMEFVRRNGERIGHLENVFLWNGDSRLFVAMIKTVEDRRNAPHDTENGLVRVILLVEDSVDYYSRFLPLMYQEIMIQTQKLIREELNDNQKYYLMRTRPKILHVKTYEEAMELSRAYAPYLISVISDIRFNQGGVPDPDAGLHLIGRLKREFEDVPMLLQSSEDTSMKYARELGVDFILKQSENLMSDLRRFIENNLGFGDFVFRNPEGEEVGRASSLAEMEEVIPRMPIESILHHAGHNHFSAWLVAHGEFQVARSLRPIRIEDFPEPEDHRRYLIRAFQEARLSRIRGKIVEFDPSVVLSNETILRLRDGSLGGKGRGIAFCNALLTSTELNGEIDRADIRIPRTLILATDEYDQFLEENRILERIHGKSDGEIRRLFQESILDRETEAHLKEYLEIVRKPLAVRSSSLLEDSHAQPFAGIYDTCLLPNSHPDGSIRLRELLSAVKQVYASAFMEETRRFIAGQGYQQDEEKMGVLIQELAGQVRGTRFYPHFSGVAQSFNYYPPPGLSHEDPVALMAVGLGRSVVEGGRAFRYCPLRPEVPCQSRDELIRYTQTEFIALNMSDGSPLENWGTGQEREIPYPLSAAEEDGMMDHLASVLTQGEIEDGLYHDGPRIINFPDIVKYDIFPLNAILSRLLVLLDKALGCPSEIEFAVDLDTRPLPVFYLLQVRPMSMTLFNGAGILPEPVKEGALIYTENSLGHGTAADLVDLIFLPPPLFDKTRTEEMVREISGINRRMKEEGRRYILLAPGRWGSADRFLGIPVNWPQIDQAAVIVEAAVHELMVEPSQGSHFFHNLTAGGIGYLMIREGEASSLCDWKKLESLPLYGKGEYFCHVRLKAPFQIVMNGRKGIARISLPDAN